MMSRPEYVERTSLTASFRNSIKSSLSDFFSLFFLPELSLELLSQIINNPQDILGAKDRGDV
jgi:hypothetical protein